MADESQPVIVAVVADTHINSMTSLCPPAVTLDDVRDTRATLTENYPWLADFVANILSSPAGLQALGRISARSL